jgi:hypothetical protein
VSSFGSIVIKGFGFSALNTTLLQMPLGAVEAISFIVAGRLTSRYKNLRLHLSWSMSFEHFHRPFNSTLLTPYSLPSATSHWHESALYSTSIQLRRTSLVLLRRSNPQRAVYIPDCTSQRKLCWLYEKGHSWSCDVYRVLCIDDRWATSLPVRRGPSLPHCFLVELCLLCPAHFHNLDLPRLPDLGES